MTIRVTLKQDKGTVEQRKAMISKCMVIDGVNQKNGEMEAIEAADNRERLKPVNGFQPPRNRAQTAARRSYSLPRLAPRAAIDLLFSSRGHRDQTRSCWGLAGNMNSVAILQVETCCCIRLASG